MAFGPFLMGIGAGAKNLRQSRMQRDAIASKKEEVGRQRMLEDVLNERQAEQHNAAMRSRSLEDALATAKLEEFQNPRPTPPPSRTTDRGIEEYVNGTWSPTGRAPYRAPDKQQDEPIVAVQGPDGQPQFVRRSQAVGKAPPAKPPAGARPNDFNNKAAFMLEGAERSSQVLDTYTAPARSWISKVPGAGNYGLTEKDQLAQQAAETMYDAYLRLTTGATISPEELKNAAKQFVPQPGDSPGGLRQKALRRREILRSMRRAAAPALNAANEPDDDYALPNP